MKLLARQQEKFEIKFTCQHNAERKNILMLNRVFQGFRLKPMHILGKDMGCYLLLLWYACNSENLSVLLEVSTEGGGVCYFHDSKSVHRTIVFCTGALILVCNWHYMFKWFCLRRVILAEISNHSNIIDSVWVTKFNY